MAAVGAVAAAQRGGLRRGGGNSRGDGGYATASTPPLIETHTMFQRTGVDDTTANAYALPWRHSRLDASCTHQLCTSYASNMDVRSNHRWSTASTMTS